MPTAAPRNFKEIEALGLSWPQLFDELPCWICLQDRDLRVIAANRGSLQDLGDLRGATCYQAFKRRSEPCPECAVLRTFEDGKDHSSEEIIFDRRGRPRDVVVNTRPLRGPGGEIVAVLKVFTDISSEKQLENRLHDSVVRFQNLFDNAPCFISVQDPQFRIVECNRRFEESFGAAGAHCYEVYKQRNARCARCPVAETFQDGEVHSTEEIVVDNKGRQMHMLVYSAPLLNAAGEVASVMKMSTDVTEIRMLQEKLATLGLLVGGIAHSIKNVLEGLRGGVYIVNLGFRDGNQQDLRTGWEMVERNVGRLSSMILDMLRCAKDRSPRPLPVPLAALVREVVGLFTPRAEKFNIRVETGISAEPEILGEAKEIHSVVANLVTNAIDACNADQDAERPHRIAVRLYRDADEAVIEVEDDGVGLDAEARNALFHTLITSKGPEGTGLGLLVSQKVAAEHGGRIAVRSEPGQGSTFTVRLPIAAGGKP